MNGNTDSTAGLVTADAGSAADHAQWIGLSGALDRAKDAIAEALRELEHCNKQEAQAARGHLVRAQGLLEEGFIQT